MIKSMAAAAIGVLVLTASFSNARAGKGAFLPTFHPKPCSGDDCKADDPRSGAPCTGLICGFSSAGAMQRPVTASEAAEAERARAAAIAAAAAVPPPAPPVKRKRSIKAKGSASTAVLPRLPDPSAPAQER